VDSGTNEGGYICPERASFQSVLILVAHFDQNIQKWGNERANRYWEAHLKPGHVPPDHKVESFIRSKYESRRWAMDGPPPADPSVLDGDAAEVPVSNITPPFLLELLAFYKRTLIMSAGSRGTGSTCSASSNSCNTSTSGGQCPANEHRTRTTDTAHTPVS
jgi:hypothetical protein